MLKTPRSTKVTKAKPIVDNLSFSPRHDIVYLSTKTYSHSVGLSCCFRQWKAESHCRLLHGYALEVTFTFAANELDGKNWVVDFGSLKSIKAWLEATFDHKLLIASDDPHKDKLLALDGFPYTPIENRLAQVLVVPAVGCEAFSRLIFEYAELWLKSNGYTPRCQLVSVEVKEHGSNSAICRRLQVPLHTKTR